MGESKKHEFELGVKNVSGLFTHRLNKDCFHVSIVRIEPEPNLWLIINRPDMMLQS